MGKPAYMRAQPFSRPTSHTLSDWASTRPPPPACWAPIGALQQLEDWPAQWATAQAAKGKGGFSSLSGPAFVPSALPQNRPWKSQPYQQGPPCSPRSAHPISSQESVTVLPPMLKALPPDWSAPHQRPEIQQAIAALHDPSTGSPAQLQQEEMDTSGSMVAASEATASEMPSKRQGRQVTEGMLISGLESVQGTRAEDDDDYNKEESDEDEDDEEESEESPVAKAKSTKPSGGGPKGKGIS